MKKQFGKLFIIFGVILCIFALVGCDLIFVDTPEPEKNPAEESSSETSELSEENTIESSEEPAEETTEETYEILMGATEENWQSGSIEAEGNDLIAELIDYLYYHSGSVWVDLIYESGEDKIDKVKDGVQALHVAFDPANYYFVCGYINPEHERDEVTYCCREKYHWVRYKSEDEIQEYYNGEKIAVAFQINNMYFAKELVPNENAVPEIKHFQLYKPEFVEGLNVNAHIDFVDTSICLNYQNEKNMYFNNDDIFYHNCVFYCISYKNQYFLRIPMGTKYYDGRYDYKYDQKKEYGKYWESMWKILIEKEGVAQIGEHLINFYGLIPIDDFVNEVLK